MSIPYWRKKEYTDDGCCIYECLSCHEQWESRTAPGSHWQKEDGTLEIHTYWNFCPHCGIKWEGEHIWDEDAWYKKKQLKYKASGGCLREGDFKVEYRYNWFPETDEHWSKWEWLQDHNFFGDEEFEKFRNRYYVPKPDNPSIKMWQKPTKYSDKFQCYLDLLKFAKMVVERSNIQPPTCDFYRHTERFQVRLVRQTWKGHKVIDTKVLWQSEEISIKHEKEWIDRI